MFRINLARIQLVLLQIVTVLFFCQIWWQVAGLTVRSEDILIIAAWGLTFLAAVLELRFRYRKVPLNTPLLGWIAVLIFGAGIAFLQPIPQELKRDSIVNAIRLGLGLSTFYLWLNHPLAPQAKFQLMLRTVIAFSFVTTFICLLQISYWGGWLPFELPGELITLHEGADDEQGREIFGLFIGNSGTHIWTGMIAVQALAVFALGRSVRNPLIRYCWYAYFIVLAFILIRTSVRNSILGLFVAVVAIIIMRALRSHSIINRVTQITLLGAVCSALIIGLFQIAPDSYFIERIRRAIPQFENGQLVIHRGSNIFGRIEFAQIALELFAEQPVVGQGFYAYASFAQQRTLLQVVHVHNSYIQSLAELGLLGFCTLVWLLIVMGQKIRSIYHTTNDDIHFQVASNWLLGVAVFTTFTAFFSNPFWEPQQMGFLFALTGIMVHWQGEILAQAQQPEVALQIQQPTKLSTQPAPGSAD